MNRILLAAAAAFALTACDDGGSGGGTTDGGAGGAGGMAAGGAGGGVGGEGGMGGGDGGAGGEAGMGGEGGGADDPCITACTTLADCAAQDDYCPGVDPGESRDALYDGCLESCANMAALATIVNNFGGDCAQVVPTVSGASADFAASCEGEGEEGLSSAEIQELFNSTCSGCHVGGAAQGGINLDDHEASTIGVEAAGAAMPQVDPGDHMNSYMYHKLAGTHMDVGGSGTRMPIGRAAWTDEQLAGYAAWIDSLPTE